MAQELPAWACTWLGEPAAVHDMIIVRAENSQRAAEIAAPRLEAEINSDPDARIEVDKVGVFPIGGPVEWFTVSWIAQAAPVAAAFACCGGSATPDGHSGYCSSKDGADD